eukprot:TRINITY_DN92188_c0_g1_i1.p1 TRINITY_DN92188_c0_g1~~TRINITY_DN92188_c0_g1_i1.p1  ORF type:complete len:273 (+),score=54.15 TRINITY_DN92188_c0_g1_i1:50-868(+)
MATRVMVDTAKHFRWYHWAGGLATAGAVNVGVVWAMGGSYHWYYADFEEKQKLFIERYGHPSEAQRLQVYTWMAPNYDEGVKLLESGSADVYRRELFRGASGDVLEVAVGTGRCFEALEQTSEVKSFVGVDVNEAMLKQARRKLADRPYDARVVHANAHRLPFADKSFDTVIGSLCLCSMEKPAVVLDEMVRVCRPNGKLFLVEPGLAKWAIVRLGQMYLGLVPSPKHAWEYGWRDDTDVMGLLNACKGLELTRLETRAMGNWYLVSAVKPE